MKEDTKSILMHLAVLLCLTIPFWIFNLDIAAQKYLYDFTAGKWAYMEHPLTVLLYRFGVYPALFLTAAAAILFGLGFAYKKFLHFRKTALLIMLTLFLGPALSINVILKSYAGRPRPREVKEFGGKMDYRNALELGLPGRGFSFPCGHASMGFLFCALYYAYRRKNAALANTALYGGIVYGTMMGVARMCQGAHFLSDTLWAGGITIISAEIVYYKILGGDGTGVLDKIKIKTENKPLAFTIAGALLLTLIAIFLFSAPYKRDRNFGLGGRSAGIIELNMDVAGDVTIMQGNGDGSIYYQAAGFGFPRRDYDGDLNTSVDKGVYTIKYRTVIKGFFSELNAGIVVVLPPAKGYRITVNDKKGDIDCSLAGDTGKITLQTNEGNIDLNAGGLVKDVLIRTDKGGVDVAFGAVTKLAPGAFIDLKAQGELGITNRSPYFKELNRESGKISGSKELYYKSRKKDGPSMSVKAGKIVIK
jgi:lipid A 4'-phosphatase